MSPRLASRLMVAHALVIGVGGITLVISAALVAPGLFHEHLLHAGVTDSQVQVHAEEAFASSFVISVVVAAGAALMAAGVVSLLLVRRLARPVEDLAQAAKLVAAGQFSVDVPDGSFARELHELSVSFHNMARQLNDTEATRIRLLADLAHELRTPLATLEAYIDGMEDGVLVTSPESWQTMRMQVARLRRLAMDLKETAAAQEHALGLLLTRLDLRDVVAAAVAADTPRYQAKGVALNLHQSDDPCWVRGDAVRLAQVLANVLDNALRYTPSSGRVDVTVTAKQHVCLVSVTDTGVGIPTSELTSVFDRFHRLDPSRTSTDGGGSGLGLTIARAIVVDHGGTLDAGNATIGDHAHAPRGAVFTMELPCVAR